LLNEARENRIDAITFSQGVPRLAASIAIGSRSGCVSRVTKSRLNSEHLAADPRVVILLDAPKTRIRKSTQVDLVIQPSRKKYALAPTGKSVVPLRAFCA